MTPKYVWFVSPLNGPYRMDFLGFGAYPYPCVTADRHPGAPVYGSDAAGAWSCPHSAGWSSRLAQYDGFEAIPTCEVDR